MPQAWTAVSKALYAPDKVWRASTEVSEVHININHANYLQHNHPGDFLDIKAFISDVVFTFFIGDI